MSQMSANLIRIKIVLKRKKIQKVGKFRTVKATHANVELNDVKLVVATHKNRKFLFFILRVSVMYNTNVSVTTQCYLL